MSPSLARRSQISIIIIIIMHQNDIAEYRGPNALGASASVGGAHAQRLSQCDTTVCDDEDRKRIVASKVVTVRNKYCDTNVDF